MAMNPDIETVVIGAGVIGLATGRALAEAGQEVIVLEQHNLVGSEISARNSEVIHAGIYYPPGSLRARLCVQGKRELYRFCAENGVMAIRCGKLLVATQAAETARLKAIVENAHRNGVEDLVPMTGEQARELEPEITCVAACLSPSTGIVDSHGLMQALEGHITSHSGQVVLNTRVVGASRKSNGLFELETEGAGGRETITAKRLVIAAGLGGTRLGDMLHPSGRYRPPRTYPAKGHYFRLVGQAPFKRLIYPMPEGAWLGLHLTFDTDGSIKFGPDVEWTDEASYEFEDADGSRLATFYREVRRYWPRLPDGSLVPDYTGIRPKIYREGEPVSDFAIHGECEHGMHNLVGLYGIESPGLTSALAIAEVVRERLTGN